MQERVSSHNKTSSKDEQGRHVSSDIAERGKELKAAIDDLLDEIDEVLEKNAEEFVAGYVQRGGE